MYIWLVSAIIVGLVVFYFLFNKGKSKKKPDYKMLFKLGLIFMLVGAFGLIRYGESIFFIIGIVYMVIGYSKKSEWKKK